MMTRIFSACRPVVLASLMAACVPAFADAQALPGLSSLRVTYNTRKATVAPQGDLKAQIDEVDRALADASRSGNAAEMRRQMARGLVLLDGGTWTPALDYQHSLVLRTDRTVIDSSVPYTARIEQIYRPLIELSPALTTRVSLRPPQSPSGPGTVAAHVVLPPTALGSFDSVSRDLRESPFPLDLDLSAVADGRWTLEAEISDGATPVATVSLGVVLLKGLDARLRALDAAATRLPENVRADVLYPGDYIRQVNRGRVRLGTFDPVKELVAAEVILAKARGGKDPFQGVIGDFERHYVLKDAGEVMPYRMYVPSNYTGTAAVPLVLALHGLGGNEDSFFEAYQKQVPLLAERHGMIMAAPLGYRVDGFYGAGVVSAADPASRRRLDYSERDVLEVLRLVRAQYSVDATRIYLMGHSMGAIGTWHLGAKYPDIWAALGTFAGMGSPATVERMKQIPEIVVHGDADPTVNVSGSRTMVTEMRRLGVDVTYIEVPGGNHNAVVVPNLPKVFEFFVAHRKAVAQPAAR